MYRFYCTVCKKIKRVQKRPILLQNGEHGNPNHRLGECNKHSSHYRSINIDKQNKVFNRMRER